MKLLNFRAMIYYEAGLTVDKKIIGKYPQIPGLIDGYNKTMPNSMTKIKWNEFPDFIPDLRYEVQRGSKVTDVIDLANTDSSGFLINEKLLDIFLKFNLVRFHYYPAQVFHLQKCYKYFLLHLLPLEDFLGIDFDKSIFFEQNVIYRSKINEVKFHDEVSFLEVFSNFKNKDHCIQAEKIILTNDFRNKNIDIFYFKFGLTRVLFSERLVDEIKKNKITGFEFQRDERVK